MLPSVLEADLYGQDINGTYCLLTSGWTQAMETYNRKQEGKTSSCGATMTWPISQRCVQLLSGYHLHKTLSFGTPITLTPLILSALGMVTAVPLQAPAYSTMLCASLLPWPIFISNSFIKPFWSYPNLNTASVSCWDTD